MGILNVNIHNRRPGLGKSKHSKGGQEKEQDQEQKKELNLLLID